jgi:hypothetical protein
MEEKKNNEELQSRREFFKKAAKGTLPILAAVALAGAPNIIRAVEESPMGCKYSACAGYCLYSCNQTCQHGCLRTCEGCKGTCKTFCTHSNYGH